MRFGVGEAFGKQKNDIIKQRLEQKLSSAPFSETFAWLGKYHQL